MAERRQELERQEEGRRLRQLQALQPAVFYAGQAFLARVQAVAVEAH